MAASLADRRDPAVGLAALALPDKLLATVVWPGGLLVASLLVSHYTNPVLFARGGTVQRSFFSVNGGSASGGGGFFVRPNGSFQYLLDSTFGHPPLRHLLVLLLAAVPPVVVAIRLLRRARRPERPERPEQPEQPDIPAARVGLTNPGAGTGPS